MRGDGEWATAVRGGNRWPVWTRRCDACGALMVQRIAPGLLLTNPPKRRVEWWCRCGATRFIRTERVPDHEDRPEWEHDWEAVNGQDGSRGRH